MNSFEKAEAIITFTVMCSRRKCTESDILLAPNIKVVKCDPETKTF